MEKSEEHTSQNTQIYFKGDFHREYIAEEDSNLSIEAYEKAYLQDHLVPYKHYGYSEFFVKRFIDIIVGLVGSIICVLMKAVLYIPYHLLPKAERGPMLFKQKRLGYHGKIIEVYKFRTMVKHSESFLEHNPDLKQKYLENGNKLTKDPRIIKFGHFLRKNSLDDFPQFFNVLKGDLSIVGPRPLLLFERDFYGQKLPYLLSVRPGITGYWTTHGRSAVEFPERADLELYYIKKHSILFDLHLVFLTIKQVIVGSEAY